ncbi:MAG: CBS domain-containing protein, partial [bacterium]|nr:CBS domain-containing protein [bacterium]
MAEALAILKEKNAHFLIVAKRHEDDEFGVVMVSDIAKHVLAPHRSPERTNVYEIMSKPALSV